MKRTFLLAATTLFVLSSALSASLVINEFMASNDTTITDGYGEYEDWIEIYNYGTEIISMAGMELSDSSNTYVIPAGVSINPGEYKLFWADDDKAPDQGPLHTNFKLGASGDEIYLYDTDGITLLDSIVYASMQLTNISYGRYPDNTGNWYTMETATPGTSNVPEPATLALLTLGALAIRKRIA